MTASPGATDTSPRYYSILWRISIYRFSRAIYRSLTPLIDEQSPAPQESRQAILEACEATVSRLILDRRYFAQPARSLFLEIREHFPIERQYAVRQVIDRNLRVAIDYLEQMPTEDAAMLAPRRCRSLTRQGTACRRQPRPGHEYCPSHRHLEEKFGEPRASAAPAGL